MERFICIPPASWEIARMVRPMLGWLVYEHAIDPHVTVVDKSTRQDGTFSRDDFTYDHVGDVFLPRRQDANHDRLTCMRERRYATARASMTAKPAA